MALMVLVDGPRTKRVKEKRGCKWKRRERNQQLKILNCHKWIIILYMDLLICRIYFFNSLNDIYGYTINQL